MDKKRIAGIAVAAAVLAAVLYWLADLVIYILIAFLVSMLGRPLVTLLNKKFSFPMALGSIISLIIILGLFSGICWIIFPMLVNQVQQLSAMDYTQIATQSSNWVEQVLIWLNDRNINIDRETISLYLTQAIRQVWETINLDGILIQLVNKVSSIGIGIFSVIFISFFFLRDEKLFKKIIVLFVPDNQVTHVDNVIQSSERLLTRYFIGLSCEMLCMMILLSAGLSIFGIENAVLYGCLGGFLNIIPYLGPVIGTIMTCFATLFNYIELGLSMDLLWMLAKVIGVFVVANLIDNLILQTFIYSTSVMAHPLEIFFVILVAGHLVGIMGMVLAIPCYTVLRIVAKEFFKDTKFVRELTQHM